MFFVWGPPGFVVSVLVVYFLFLAVRSAMAIRCPLCKDFLNRGAVKCAHCGGDVSAFMKDRRKSSLSWQAVLMTLCLLIAMPCGIAMIYDSLLPPMPQDVPVDHGPEMLIGFGCLIVTIVSIGAWAAGRKPDSGKQTTSTVAPPEWLE